ncbi:hypothetical protein FOL46_006861 [Perkinsus olseni]|uniref:C2 domain-containing protein n=1 Tax=Perkinsus olseni TaxID=32597 RepID=A0A7J6LHU0_PEROL|nr:hypothetical protein FOL46_006861 [Perkinsus olseni]
MHATNRAAEDFVPAEYNSSSAAGIIGKQVQTMLNNRILAHRESFCTRVTYGMKSFWWNSSRRKPVPYEVTGLLSRLQPPINEGRQWELLDELRSLVDSVETVDVVGAEDADKCSLQLRLYGAAIYEKYKDEVGKKHIKWKGLTDDGDKTEAAAAMVYGLLTGWQSTPRSIRIAPAGVSAAQTSTAEGPPSEVDREEHQSTDGLIKNIETWIDIKKRVMRHQETGHHQEVENQSTSTYEKHDLGDKYRPAKTNATSKNPPIEEISDDREDVGWSAALLKTLWSSSGSLDEAQPEEDERLPSSAELKPTQNVPSFTPSASDSPGDDGRLWGYLSSARDRMVSAARALAAPEDDAPIRPILLREFGGAVEDVVIAVHVKKCTNVPMMDLIGHADCYVTVQIDTTGIARDGDSSGPRSRTVYNESDPVFNEWVETPPLRAVELLSPNAMLRLTVLDWDIVGSDDLVGTCVYPLYETLQCSGVAPYVLSPLNGQSAYSAGEKPSVNLFVGRDRHQSVEAHEPAVLGTLSTSARLFAG